MDRAVKHCETDEGVAPLYLVGEPLSVGPGREVPTDRLPIYRGRPEIGLTVRVLPNLDSVISGFLAGGRLIGDRT